MQTHTQQQQRLQSLQPMQRPGLMSQLPPPPQPHLQQHPPGADTPPRKRSKKDRACDLCRRKKIRCDFDQTCPQNSCSSCRSYGKVCTFNEAAKKRGPPKGYVEGLENRLKRMEELLMNIAANGNLPADAVKAMMENNTTTTNSQPSEDSDMESHDTSQSEDSHIHRNGSAQGEGTASPELVDREEKELSCLSDNAIKEKKSGHEPLSYVGSSSGIYILNRLFAQDTSNMRIDEKNALPRPLEGHEEDLMILRHGCEVNNKLSFGRILNPNWKLPPKDLTDHLVKIYFKRMNPMLPILDEEQFYEEYHKANHAATFIPIVISVCRATCRLMKDDDPFFEEYNINRSNLFSNLHKQLELYFDMDFLEPRIETIQVLLLNSSNASKWGIESADWISASIAIKMAQDLGLHRANTQQEGIPKKDMEAKKRLWWSAYVIDRWVCASLGRPLTISDADCDIGFPDPNDTKYALFTHLVKLAIILGDTLRALCSPRARLMSEKGVNLENISRNLEQMLLEWKSSLPADLNLTEKELSRISRKDLDPGLERKLNDGAGKLLLAYCAVYLLSKRPFISAGLGLGRNRSIVQMPLECFNCLTSTVDVFDVIDVTSLLCGWTLSSYCISQTQMLLLLNYQNADANLIAKSKNLATRFKERHHVIALYITQPSIVPFLEALANVVVDNEHETDPSQSRQDHSTAAVTGSTISANKGNETISDQQSWLWNASNGIEWQDMFKLLAETGYQI
ncbi:MAG: fungal-specific transcription factor domain-containing protein [Benjaminiella poitrasii]|nr:MAG: fungal-specific transcription factor domain-containing protein [Benjaminiella poitrasii]